MIIMENFTIYRSQFIDKPRDVVFSFFSKPENLEYITPPYLHFKIMNTLPVSMKEGQIINYKLRIRGFSIKWSSDLKNKINKTFLKLNKIYIRVENLTLKEKNNLSIKNYIFLRSSEIETDLKVYESFIEFKSTQDSKIKNNRLSYFGKINKNPFHLNMNLDLEKLNFKKNIFNNNFLRNLFELRQFYSENLSSNINLRVDKMLKNKLFDSSNIFINYSTP